MAGSSPPESAWYIAERIEEWMELFDVPEEDVEMVIGPKIDDETGDWRMEIYGRYQPEGLGFDGELNYTATVDYSSVDLDLEDMETELELWRKKLEENFPEIDKYYSQLDSF